MRRRRRHGHRGHRRSPCGMMVLQSSRSHKGGHIIRLAVLSDLHAAARLPEAIRALSRAVEVSGADWLICAGDVGGGGAADCLRCLRTMDQALGGHLLFVPGNHDIWCHPRSKGDSWDEWKRLLAFPGNLERGPRALAAGWCAVGTGGWYDYSLAAPGPWSDDDVARKQWGSVLWRDAEFARWGAPDGEIAEGFARLLEQRLQDATQAGTRIVAVTHVVPFGGVLSEPREAAQPPTSQTPSGAVGSDASDADRSLAFCRAFMGSTVYGAALTRHRCAYAAFGHSHVRRRGTSEGGVPYVAAPLGYPKEWQGSGEVAEEIAGALALIDL